MPDGLTIGSGIANGVDKFVENFTQARMMKHQQKMQENAPLIALLTRQIEDDNISIDDRAAMVDAIPGLLGVKNMPRSLSQHMGLDKIKRDQLVADPNKPAQAATPNSNLQDSNVDDSAPTGMNPSIAMQGTQEVLAGQVRYGDLTPADLKLQRALKLKQADSADDINKQTQLLELQQRLYLRGGYNIIPNSGFFDESGNYFQKAMNTAGETKNISFGKVKPAAIAIQEEKNKAISAGGNSKLGQLQKANQIVSEYEADNTSHPLSDYNAARSLLGDFEKTGQVKDAQIVALGQGNTGTKKIQPAQSADDARADAQLRDKIQSDIDTHQANIQASQKVIADLTPRKKAADAELQAATAAFDAMVKAEDYTPDDAEYKAANIRKVRAQQQVNQLSTQLNAAVSAHEKANSLLTGAQGRLNSIGSGGSSGSNPKNQAAIQQFMKDNPKVKDPAEAERILRSAGRIK